MAVYSDGKGWPDGVDMVFNTIKPSGTPMLGPKDNSVLKPIKKDSDNPFGTLIKEHERGGQSYYTDADGNQHLRVINKKSDEGDWERWSKQLPAQFLSKQPIKLIQDQLAISAFCHQRPALIGLFCYAFGDHAAVLHGYGNFRFLCHCSIILSCTIPAPN